MSAQRIVFRSFGVPEDVVEVETIEPSPPSANEVSVRMEAAPINPADLNYIEGVYGVKPDLPAAAGLEGFGRVSATGPGVTTLAVGDPVIFLSSRGTWASEVVCPAGSVIPIPAGLDPIQAAMLKVNPLTALRLLQDFGQPPAGAWVAQNAANSAVGQCVIQVAKAIGLRTLMQGADLCITGEGRIDSQTAFGKTPCGVAGVADEFTVPCLAIAGAVSPEPALNNMFDAVFSLCNAPMSLEEAMQPDRAGDLIAFAAQQAVRCFRAGIMSAEKGDVG